MSESDRRTPDPLIDEVRKTRQRLVEEHGGLRGWVEYLQELERQDPPKRVLRKRDATRR